MLSVEFKLGLTLLVYTFFFFWIRCSGFGVKGHVRSWDGCWVYFFLFIILVYTHTRVLV